MARQAFTYRGSDTLGRTGRVMRRPQHPFAIRHYPFQITPFFIAPVLPGETMKSLVFQSRAVTDPIKNPIVGWWMEYYFFYVKHRDLTMVEFQEDLVLNTEFDPTTVDDTVRAEAYYHSGGAGAIPWVKLCLQRVTEEYFRDEGEAWDVKMVRGLPLARIQGQNWTDTMALAADVTALDVEVAVDTVGGDHVNVSDIETAYRTWDLLRQQHLTNQSYEEFLATYGIRPSSVEMYRPELIRFVREWSYPTNTVAATSIVGSQLSWSVTERADKDRFFNEPGFLFGVSVCRPKVYWYNQEGSVSAFLNNLFAWMPAVLRGDHAASLKLMTDNDPGLFGGIVNGDYWIDVRDLYIHGEQFINDLQLVDYTAASHTGSGWPNFVSVPEADLQRKYLPGANDSDGLAIWKEIAKFFGVDEAATGSITVTDNYYVRQDGVVNVNILGSQTDTTPTRTIGVV